MRHMPSDVLGSYILKVCSQAFLHILDESKAVLTQDISVM